MPNNQELIPPTHSVSEKGHAKNVENVKKIRNFAMSWGAQYTPTNAILMIPFITQRISDAENVNDILQNKRAPYRVAVSVAEDSFAPLSKLMTRLERGFAASGVADSAVDDLKTYTRKVKGKRASAETDAAVPEKSHSASQMSRVNRTENLDAAIAQLIAYGFKPNEVDLTTSALQTLSNGLKAKTDAVNTTFVPISNSLDDRDEIYYQSADSLYEISRAFEDYVISHFGYDSDEHNQIRDLDVAKIKRKKNAG